MQREVKIYRMLGLARRAGVLKSGEFQTEELIRSGGACLVIVAEDASGNTRKRFQDKCEHYHVPFALFGTKEALGHATGTEMRSSAALGDRGFAEAVLKLLEQNERD